MFYRRLNGLSVDLLKCYYAYPERRNQLCKYFITNSSDSHRLLWIVFLFFRVFGFSFTFIIVMCYAKQQKLLRWVTLSFR